MILGVGLGAKDVGFRVTIVRQPDYLLYPHVMVTYTLHYLSQIMAT